MDKGKDVFVRREFCWPGGGGREREREKVIRMSGMIAILDINM